MHQTVPWCFGARSTTFIADGLPLPPPVTCHFLMTNSPSSEELLQQIQIGLYVVTVCLRRLNSILCSMTYSKRPRYFSTVNTLFCVSRSHAEINSPGAYAILFGFYLYILRTRGAANRRFLTVATISLFILCTAHCAFVLASVIFDNMALATAIYSPSGGEPLSGHSVEWNRAANAVYVTSKCVSICIELLGAAIDKSMTRKCASR
jgi:hypothetical protein